MAELQSASNPRATQVPDAPSGSGVSSGMAGRSSTSTHAPHLSDATSVGSTAADVGGVSTPGGKGGRSTFAAQELAIVCSHYDLGVIAQIKEFPRGSRKAPKLLLKTDQGTYLLKRRARGKDNAFKVAFCHGIQLHLAERQFPLPHLIGTRRDNNSMLQWKEGIYELFEYIKGGNYDGSLEATAEAGRILALFHKLLRDYKPKYQPPKGAYHASKSVNAAMQQAPKTLRKLQPDATEAEEASVRELVHFLHKTYVKAAKKVEAAGLRDWPAQIVHSDWHPGNMLFRGSRVVAVIDYDAARIQQRIIDVANGALQFSIVGGGDDASSWPDYIDESRFKRFIRGYDSVPDAVLTRAELRVVPWLMIEALIAESVIPIAATGYFARMEGVAFMTMVRRKVRWLGEHAEAMIQSVED